VYERAIAFFGEEHMDQTLLMAFATFEEMSKEYERARVIYKYGLDLLGRDRAAALFAAYTQFEKKHGTRAGIEEVLVNKRRVQYEDAVRASPHNYDAWFDFIRLEESTGDVDAIRDVYERAIANVPPAAEKRLWRRYIYLWIYYAVFEELVAHDVDRARDVYRACLDVIPHKKFTFGKVWLLYALLEVRAHNVGQARRILGQALGRCPKDKLFRGYIDLELKLREFDRCRVLYEKWLEYNPANCATWIKYAELETALGDRERARGIFELAVGQAVLDMPEVVWKAYIDFETEDEEWGRARGLYRRLLDKTHHVKVYLAHAAFEAAAGAAAGDMDGGVRAARGVYEEAEAHMRDNRLKDERVVVLEAWREFEEQHETGHEAEVARRMPKKVKKRRLIDEDLGVCG
jgi:crooked neck